MRMAQVVVTDMLAGETQRETRSRNESIVCVLDCTQQLTVGKRLYARSDGMAPGTSSRWGHEVAARERVVLRQSEFVVVDAR